MYIEEVLNKELDYAIKEGEVPIAALITKNEEVLVSSHNTKESEYDVCAHAEINCIRQLCRLKKCTNLRGCVLYSTVKPCPMCLEAIKAVKIATIHYYIDEAKIYNNKITLLQEKSTNSPRYKQVLVDFFKSKR